MAMYVDKLAVVLLLEIPLRKLAERTHIFARRPSIMGVARTAWAVLLRAAIQPAFRLIL